MIAVIIPARNEVASVGGVVQRVRAALGEEELEIVVVDDGSEDGTGEAARAAGASKVLRTEGIGYGAAIKRAAAETRCEWLALIDADGSYPEDALPVMWNRARQGARQVIGARPAFGPAESWARSGMKLMLRLAVRIFGGVAVPDLNSGLRLVRRADVVALSDLLPARFSLTTTLTLALEAAGGPTVFVPITYRPRGGSSKWRPFSDTWRMTRVVYRGIGWLRAGRVPHALPAESSP